MSAATDSSPRPLPGSAVVVAVKDLERAKSRVVLPASLRRLLVTTMLLDTVAAWAEVASEVLVVSGSPLLGAQLRRAGLPAQLIPDPGAGLNHAFTIAAESLTAPRIAACVADLPCLTAAAARDVLTAGSPGERWMVPDEAGQGTTILAADGVPLEPGFEHGSAERHRRGGAREIEAAVAARCDVDDIERLDRAAEIGLGRWTASLFADGRLVDDVRVLTVAASTETGWDAIDQDGRQLVLPRAAAPAPRLAPGQRLHCTVHQGRVHLAWW